MSHQIFLTLFKQSKTYAENIHFYIANILILHTYSWN